MKGGGGTLFREPSRRADGPAPLHASAPLPGRRRGSSGGRESNTPPPQHTHPPRAAGSGTGATGPSALKVAVGAQRGARPCQRPGALPGPGPGPGDSPRPGIALQGRGAASAPSAACPLLARRATARHPAPPGIGPGLTGRTPRRGPVPAVGLPPASPHLCGAAPRRSPPPASSPAPSLPRGKRGALSPRPPVGCEPPRRPPPTPACGTARWRAGGRVRPTFEELHLLELEGDVVAAGENIDGAAGLREQVQVQLQPHPAAARPCHPPPEAARPAWAGGRRPPPG